MTTEAGMTFPRPRVCLHCGKAFQARRLRHIYCTWACHRAAHQEVSEAECKRNLAASKAAQAACKRKGAA